MSSMGFLTDIMAGGISAGAAAAMTGAAGQLLGQTATGASQGTAFLMGAPTVEFTTVAAGTGALLPAVTVGGRINGADTILVVNNGANALLVYPPIGFKIVRTQSMPRFRLRPAKRQSSSKEGTPTISR